MKICPRCHRACYDDDLYCGLCGLPLSPEEGARFSPAAEGQAGAAGPNRYGPPSCETPAVPRAQNSGRSIALFLAGIALFFVLNPLGTPLAAAGALMAAVSNAADTADAGRRRRISLLLCCLAAAADVLTLAFLLGFEKGGPLFR